MERIFYCMVENDSTIESGEISKIPYNKSYVFWEVDRLSMCAGSYLSNFGHSFISV